MTTIKELMNLSGRRALITGANGSLGRIFSESLAELGADLVLVDLEKSDLELFSSQLTTNCGVAVEIFSCNLEIQSERSKLINRIMSTDKTLDILINSAALVGSAEIQGWSVPFEQQSIETWRRAFEVNLTAVFDLCQGLMPLIKASKNGSIINIASIYGTHGPNWSLYKDTKMGNPAAYAASKAGLIQLTRWLATTVAPEVRVNAISPGGILRNQESVFIERYEQMTPLGRMAIQDDIRGALIFFASDLSKYVTGQNLHVDGGWSSW
jgi:NAD(P)-dependent dehydrogenase (short-subunit alcohol dehydrogenase family)